MEKKEELTLRPEIEVNYRDRWPIRRTNEKSLQSEWCPKLFRHRPPRIWIRSRSIHNRSSRGRSSRGGLISKPRVSLLAISPNSRFNKGSKERSFDLSEILLNLINLIESYSRGWSFFRYLMDDRWNIEGHEYAINTGSYVLTIQWLEVARLITLLQFSDRWLIIPADQFHDK